MAHSYNLAMPSLNLPFELLAKANEMGVRLEVVDGLPVWEMSPSYAHQKAILNIQTHLIQSLAKKKQTNCNCVHISDVYIRFADGSIRRPDLAIFCREPDVAEQNEAITLIPEAVVEIISPGYEKKDLTIGQAFYLAQGVKDVVIHDPRDGMVWHITKAGHKILSSPVTLTMQCGCEVTI